MRKIYKLKKWYTLDEAGKRLTVTLGEPVGRSDILQFMSDGHLQIFWRLVKWDGVRIKLNERTSSDGASEGNSPRSYRVDSRSSLPSSQLWIPVRESDLTANLDGVFRLEPFVDAETHEWLRSLDSGNCYDPIPFDGTLVCDENGVYWELMESNMDMAAIVRFEFPEPGKPYNHISYYRSCYKLPLADEIITSGSELERLESELSESGVKYFPIDTDRTHVSNKMARMIQAAMKFWGNSDRHDRGTHPENRVVSAWLEQQGFSSTLADRAASLIRPEWAPTGRKPDDS